MRCEEVLIEMFFEKEKGKDNIFILEGITVEITKHAIYLRTKSRQKKVLYTENTEDDLVDMVMELEESIWNVFDLGEDWIWTTDQVAKWN